MGVIHVSAWFSFPVAPIIELLSCHREIAFMRQVLQSADISLLQTKHGDHTRIGEIYRVVNRAGTLFSPDFQFPRPFLQTNIYFKWKTHKNSRRYHVNSRYVKRTKLNWMSLSRAIKATEVLALKTRHVSSFIRPPVCWAGGRTSWVRIPAGPTLRVLK